LREKKAINRHAKTWPKGWEEVVGSAFDIVMEGIMLTMLVVTVGMIAAAFAPLLHRPLHFVASLW